MLQRSKKLASWALVFVLMLSMLAGTLPLQTSAATGSNVYNPGTRSETCTTLSGQAQAYYTNDYTWESLSALDGGNDSCLDTDNPLFQALNQLMSSTMTNSITYRNLKGNGFEYADTTEGTIGSYSLFYSSKLNTDYSNNDISREHVWPKSHATFHEKNGGADLHHLRPEYSNVNSARGNYVLGNVNGVYEKYSTYQNNGTIVFYKYGDGNSLSGRCEIPDNVKGDVARILLYVWCRWQQPNLFMDISNATVDSSDTPKKNKNDGIRVIESLETLLQWCEEDPVDTWEMGRNDAAERIQGNRNVFIDYPEYAWLLFGQPLPSDMTTPSGEANNLHNGTDTCQHDYTSVVTAPTCTADGYTTYTCSLCGDSYQDDPVDKIDHIWDEGKVTTEATCTAPGVKTFTCSACTQTKTEEISATGHSYGDWQVTIAATEQAEGEESRRCTACGEAETRPTEKLPPSPSATAPSATIPSSTVPSSTPNTTNGAEQNSGSTAMIVVTMTAVALCGVGVFFLLKKKNA